MTRQGDSNQTNNQNKVYGHQQQLSSPSGSYPEPINSPHGSNVEEESKVMNIEHDLGVKCPFEIGEHIDSLDTVNHWLNAEVRNDQIRVHYSGWSVKYDEWIDWHSNRVQKQCKLIKVARLNVLQRKIGKKGMHFHHNNRLDVLDETEKWLEARVIDVEESRIKIHYYGYAKKFDEWIPKNSDRIAEVGTHSKAFGNAKFRKYNGKVAAKRSKISAQMLDEDQFRKKLYENKRFMIVNIEGDGNCLFRSFSHQLYGKDDYHQKIRQICMDYISLERDFFKNYIIGGGDEDIDYYIQRKSEDGVWGDDLEIQALSEIYNRSIEIYAYTSEPLRTFHENAANSNSEEPIRISYHGRSHYASVKRQGKEEDPLLETVFGQIENIALRNAQARADKLKDMKENGNLHPGKTYNDCLINEVLQSSRTNFENTGKRDMEAALEESVEQYEKERGARPDQEVEKMLKESMDTYEREMDEERLVEATINESKKLQEDQDEELKKVLEMSKADYALQNDEYPTSVNQVLSAGFPVEFVLEAYQIVGNNPDLMTTYICETLMN